MLDKPPVWLLYLAQSWKQALCLHNGLNCAWFLSSLRHAPRCCGKMSSDSLCAVGNTSAEMVIPGVLSAFFLFACRACPYFAMFQTTMRSFLRLVFYSVLSGYPIFIFRMFLARVVWSPGMSAWRIVRLSARSFRWRQPEC